MKSSQYEDDVAQELHKMTMKIAVKVKDHNFFGKGQLSVITFPEEFRSACNSCGIHKRTATCLFKQFITSWMSQ